MAAVIDFNFELGPIEGLVFGIAIAAIGFMIWMLIDAIGRPPEQFGSPNAKTGWIVGLIAGFFLGFGFIGVIVAFAYLVMVKLPARTNEIVRAWTPPAPPPPGAAESEAPPPPMPPAMPAHCRNCGAKVVAGARFCHSCGAPLA